MAWRHKLQSLSCAGSCQKPLHKTVGQSGTRECIRRARVEDWAAAWRAMARLDVLDQVKRLHLSTPVAAGQNDLSSTPEVMLETAQAISDAIYTLIDPGTHMMVLNNLMRLQPN